MSVSLLPNGEQQFIDGNGVPYAAGLVYFYVPNTLTLKNTWKDAAGTILNTNPVVLDAAGRAIIYGNGQYRQILQDSLGNTIWDQLTSDISYAVSQAGFLLSTNNLSDVANAATSLANLAGAPLASPAFTGIPTAPTAAPTTNNTQLATTAYVQSALTTVSFSHTSCEARLTLTSGVPVTTADVVGAANVFFTPYKGNNISLFDGTSAWNLLSFSELTISLASGFANATAYDVFAFNNAGVVALETLAWTNSTTRATALVMQNGVYVKTGATTRRYIGTFFTTSATATEDSKLNRYVWNYYNRAARQLFRAETAGSWGYAVAAVRQANANVLNQLNFFAGVVEDTINANLFVTATINSGPGTYSGGIGVDSITVITSNYQFTQANATFLANSSVQYCAYPGLGKHFLSWLEFGSPSFTTTWNGTTGSGLTATWFA